MHLLRNPLIPVKWDSLKATQVIYFHILFLAASWFQIQEGVMASSQSEQHFVSNQEMLLNRLAETSADIAELICFR